MLLITKQRTYFLHEKIKVLPFDNFSIAKIHVCTYMYVHIYNMKNARIKQCRLTVHLAHRPVGMYTNKQTNKFDSIGVSLTVSTSDTDS